jgi:hypothetical protein
MSEVPGWVSRLSLRSLLLGPLCRARHATRRAGFTCGACAACTWKQRRQIKSIDGPFLVLAATFVGWSPLVFAPACWLGISETLGISGNAMNQMRQRTETSRARPSGAGNRDCRCCAGGGDRPRWLTSFAQPRREQPVTPCGGVMLALLHGLGVLPWAHHAGA